MGEPKIIQGGMGVAVSSWPLARTVSSMGQLGVVSGTGLDVVLSRRLQDGDPGGHLRRALASFPFPEIAQRIVHQYFSAEGRRATDPYRRIPMWTARPSVAQQQLCIAANFVEVFLAKEGHEGLVGINYLEKIQLPTLPSLYGAMLAGVDYILMGAGIPREVPGILDRLAENLDAELTLHVDGASTEDDFTLRFDARAALGDPLPKLRRPRFLAIVASNLLATTMARKSTGRVDGFVVEGQTAGGHNAPPRGPLTLNELGEPVYGPRDVVDLEGIRKLGAPFWLAGSYASPQKLREAIALGAAGVQVGTAFAFSRESGICEEWKRAVIAKARLGKAGVFTDPIASPTGFPFKVARLEGTLSERAIYEARPRLCDVGYLRHAYKEEDGSLGYRCPAEPVEQYGRKGGTEEEAAGRRCLCNCLLANVGLAQHQESGYTEAAMLTSGDDIDIVQRFLRPGEESYSARDVVRYLTGEDTQEISG